VAGAFGAVFLYPCFQECLAVDGQRPDLKSKGIPGGPFGSRNTGIRMGPDEIE
jgi:hypothetical protein